MKVQFELVIGENKYTLIEDVESNKDFFKKLHFYSALPKVGPNGETDLALRYRKTKDGHDYYSIVTEKGKKEFKFGQQKGAGEVLFPKGWEPLYNAGNSEEDGEGQAPSAGLGSPSVGLGGAQPQQAQSVGLGAPAAQQYTPAPAAPAATPPPAASQQVNDISKDILASFGI